MLLSHLRCDAGLPIAVRARWKPSECTRSLWAQAASPPGFSGCASEGVVCIQPNAFISCCVDVAGTHSPPSAMCCGPASECVHASHIALATGRELASDWWPVA